MSNRLYSIVTSALVLITLITGIVAGSVYVGADDNNATVTTMSLTVAASCSISVTEESVHNASIPNGIYSGTELYPDGIGKTRIATFCNDNSGYAIYAIGYTGDRYDGEDHTKLIGASSGQKISTGTATSGSTSSWAMKLTKVNDSAVSYNPEALTIENNYDDYNVIPSKYTKVADYTSTTDLTLGSVLSTTYAVYVSPAQLADVYTGKVKYTLVHPHTDVPIQPQTTGAGKICYYANASDAVGTMGCQSIASSVTLLAGNFSRTGYGFAGWSDKFDYATNSDAKFYGPMETISLNTEDYSGSNPGLSLYAVWIKSQGNLQDATKVADICSSLTIAPIDGTANLSSASALTDERDNNTYAIAKLADGKCWMIENMRLANKDSDNNDVELSASNTNNPSLPLTNSNTESTTSNHLSPSTNPSSSAWCNSNSSTCLDQSMLYTGNTANRGSTPGTNANTYSYGNYYNWYSATAGNGTYSKASGDAAGDVCPKGWTLPTGGTNKDFATLYSSLSSKIANIRKYPNNFIYPGYVYESSIRSRGTYGFYWSKSASSNYNAYRFYFYSSGVYPSSPFYKSYGFSIRCRVR